MTNRPSRLWLLWLALGLAGLAPAAPATRVEASVVIVANARQPESVELARFYARQRGVPPGNIVALAFPEAESITWRQFVDQVWQPLQDELYRRGWLEGTTSSLLDRMGRRRHAPTGHRISYLVLCRGVPLRIYNNPALLNGRKANDRFNRNDAAVDSELSLLAFPNHETTSLLANPLFAQDGTLSFDATAVIKVSRLDGPDWADARRLVTSALVAEQMGLVGRYYLDLHGPHREGDEWLESVRAQLEGLGYSGEVEDTQAGFAAYARFAHAALYFGWYAESIAGPMEHEGFAFAPGAVALHIHSYSAQTLRDPAAGWAGPLVARGAAATVGNVFEPYLQLTHRPNLLLRALSEGHTFGEAVYYALPALSWQAVAVGDPLYRPFKVTLAEQLSRVREPGAAALVRLRQANVLAQRGLIEPALDRLAEAARLAGVAGDVALAAEVAARRERLARGDDRPAPGPPIVVK
jgi:uncharacterized protein (TIGR03790 family)